jgi:hypothetical protein
MVKETRKLNTEIRKTRMNWEHIKRTSFNKNLRKLQTNNCEKKNSPKEISRLYLIWRPTNTGKDRDKLDFKEIILMYNGEYDQLQLFATLNYCIM